jgi:hypothetical protein
VYIERYASLGTIWHGHLNVYQTGNLIDSNMDLVHDPDTVLSNDTYFMRATDPFGYGIYYNQFYFSNTPFASVASDALSAEDAYQQVLATAGASLVRDAVDQRLVSEVTTQGGAIIDSQDEVGGFPVMVAAARASDWDTDGDGMPNWWEAANGLNPNSAADGIGTAANGYTNLENYINGLAGDPLVATPEPGTLALLATGLAGLLAYAWRRRSRAV